MSDFLALLLYTIALFFLALGNAIIVYHILRYRDPHDASGAVLIAYIVLVIIILTGTIFLIDWSSLAGLIPV